MIHAFEGREEWEVDVDWAGVDGRLDVSLCEDVNADFAAVAAARARVVRSTATEEEVESTFLSLRKDLIQHYAFADLAGEIRWLRSATEAQV